MDAAVGRHAIAAGSQQFAEGLAGVVAGQVPQHIVDFFDHAAAGVKEALGVPQPLPDILPVKGVDADQHGGDIGLEPPGFEFQIVLVEAVGKAAVGIQRTVG